MRNWITFARAQGVCSRQAHCDLPEGTFERELGKEGFFGPATHMYHSHPPTGWVDWQGPLRPRAFDTVKLGAETACPWDAPVILANAACEVRLWRCDAQSDLARNADGDQVLFIHAGRGALYCDYGHLDYVEGDYLVLPRSTMWRLAPTVATTALMVEATNDGYGLPAKGPVGNHAIFDPAILDVPAIDDAFRAQQGEVETRVRIKARNRVSVVTYPFNPLDAVGWKGDLAAVRLNWRDIRPLMSHRYHLPPSAHTTWLAGRFVICTFVPRPIESDPGALKVPFYHSNDDYDEVIFYHRGQFFSRDNIHPGMITFHPAGFPHGPHPKAFEAGRTFARKETDEVAVMIDTRDPLEVGPALAEVEAADYVHSWKTER